MSWYFIPPLLGALFTFTIGIYVYTNNRANIVNKSFSLFCFFLFLWLSSYALDYMTSDKKLASIYCNIACTAVNFLFPTLYLFVAAYLNKVKEEKIWIFLFYITMLLLLPFFVMTKLFLKEPYLYYWGHYSQAGPLHPFYIGITILIWAKGLLLFFDRPMWARFSEIEKNKAKYILGLYIISSFGASDYIQKYGVEIYPLGWLFAVLFAIVTAYAIIRHKLMDIRVAFKKTLIFAAVFAVAYAVIAFFTLFLQSGFEKFFVGHKLVVSSIAHTGSWPSVILFGLKINIFSIPPFVTSILTLFLGIFVYLRNKKESQNFTYLLLCLSIFLWLFFVSALFSSAKDEKIINFLAKMVFVGVTFIPITFYHFVISFLKIKNQKNVIRIAYLIGLVFIALLFFTNLYISGAHEFFWGYYPKAGILEILDVLLFMLLYGNSLWLLYKKMKAKDANSAQRVRMKYVLIAFFVAAGGAIDYIPNYGYSIYPFGYIFIFVMISIFAYAIVRHKLLDVEVIIKKTLIFTGLFTVVYVIFAFFAFLGQMFFERFVTHNRWISMIPSVLVVTVMLRPLENFLVGITDKYLFQKKYDYRELLKIFTSEVLTVLELDKLIRLTEEKLAEIMKLKSCKVEIDSAQPKAGPHNDGELKLPIEIASSSRQGGTRNDGEVELSLPIEITPPRRDYSNTSHLGGGTAIGTLVLGKKKSDEGYTQEDLDILQPLTKTLGIAISNAKLFEELARMRAETAQKDKMATIGTLAAGMAHEIRNPITTIRNFADYLPEKYNDSVFVSKFEKLIPREIDRVESIARSLLEFSSGEGTGEREEFGIDEPMKTVIAILEPQYRTSGISIICDHKEKHVVKANRVQLQDAFFNMLNYIFAEIQKNGKIVIECAMKESALTLYIRSKDLVVADHIIKDVFEPVSGLYKEKRGFGFNLFIAKELIERSGATLKIYSDEVSGSEFRIEFKR